MSRSIKLFESFINREGVDRKKLNDLTIKAGFIEYLKLCGYKDSYIKAIISDFIKQYPYEYPFYSNFQYESTPEGMEEEEVIKNKVLLSIGHNLINIAEGKKNG